MRFWGQLVPMGNPNGLILKGDLMVRLTQSQINELEINMMRKRNQPIPNSDFLYGEDVIWVPDGYLDHDLAQLYDIQKTKALIFNSNNGPNKYRWVPLKHLYKKVKSE